MATRIAHDPSTTFTFFLPPTRLVRECIKRCWLRGSDVKGSLEASTRTTVPIMTPLDDRRVTRRRRGDGCRIFPTRLVKGRPARANPRRIIPRMVQCEYERWFWSSSLSEFHRLPPRGPADYFRPVSRIGPPFPVSFRSETNRHDSDDTRADAHERTRHEREKSEKESEEGKVDR